MLQLTPAFAPGDHTLDELEPVVQALAPVPVAIELRHRDWLHRQDHVLDWYRDAGAVFVCVDAPQNDAPMAVPALDAVTRSDLAYLRALGRDAKDRMTYRYTDAELEELAARGAHARRRRRARHGRVRQRRLRARGRPGLSAHARVDVEVVEQPA